jgi:hypothetical protein
MDELRKLPRAKLDNIDKILHSLKDDISMVPHIILVASQVEGEENVGWMHSQIMAKVPELVMMFVQLLKSNRDIKRAVEMALLHIKEEEGGANSIKSIIGNAVTGMIKKIAESDEEFMKSLQEEMDDKSGSAFDVEGLLNEVLGKKDKDKEDNDKEGDK